MEGFLGSFFLANIFDDGGELIETKKIKWTFTRPKQKTFSHNEKEYFIPNTSFMFKLVPFPFLFTYWFTSYQINNPNPIKQHHGYSPVMSARSFYNLLHETVLEKLMAARKGFLSLLTPRNIIIGLIVIGVFIYFMSGGSVDGVKEGVTNLGK